MSLVLTLEEKLAAVQRGEAGSYNFARPFGGPRNTHFQALAREALSIARARGYFWRAEGNPDGVIIGLLVTISDPSA